eukprot:scaffold9099_cov135-Isochrysis_galbana.AAC.3
MQHHMACHGQQPAMSVMACHGRPWPDFRRPTAHLSPRPAHRTRPQQPQKKNSKSSRCMLGGDPRPELEPVSTLSTHTLSPTTCNI